MRQCAIFRFSDQWHTASRILDAYLDQRQSNHEHDQARDKWRQPVSYSTDDGPEEKVEDASDDDASHQRRHAELHDDGNHDGNEGETGSLHDRKPRAHRTDADGLDQRGNTGERHRHLDHSDHVGYISRAEAGSTCHDDRGSHIAHEHRKHMLDSQGSTDHDTREVVWIAHRRGRHTTLSACHGEPRLNDPASSTPKLLILHTTLYTVIVITSGPST